MKLHLTFSDENPSKPVVSVESGEKIALVRRERWQQFLALLVYRCLTGVEDGWVRLDEIQNLSAFHPSRDKVIGKYLATSRFEFPTEVTRFLNRTMDVSTTGPYKLILGRENIDTDLPRLEHYLELVTVRSLPDRMDCQSLWLASQLTLDKFELKSCLQILQNYIQIADKEEPVPDYQLPLAYIRMARVGRLAYENDIDVMMAIKTAWELSEKIKAPYERRMLLAYTLAVEAIIVGKDENTYKAIKRLNNRALAILDEIAEETPDKVGLLAHINYTNYNAAVFNSTSPYNPRLEWADQRDLERALELYGRLEQIGAPLLVDVEKGILEGTSLLMVSIRAVLGDEDLPEGYLERYQQTIARDAVSRFITLNTGVWIRQYYQKRGDLRRAYSFGQECLISHVNLHETRKFQWLVADQKELKEKMDNAKGY